MSVLPEPANNFLDMYTMKFQGDRKDQNIIKIDNDKVMQEVFENVTGTLHSQ